MSRLSRTKGKVYEQEIARVLRVVYPGARRSYGQARRGHDEPDVVGTPWWVECCHGKAPNIRAKYMQAIAAITAAGTALQGPLVITRRDREDDLVTLPLDLFMRIIARAEGGVCGQEALARITLPEERE